MSKNSISEKIKKRSAELILEEIKINGFIRVANPIKVKQKVLKYTGVDLLISDFILKFNKEYQQKLF